MNPLVYGIVLVFVISLSVLLGWDVGLYGAQLVSHKIDFLTAFGLTVCGLVVGNLVVAIIRNGRR